MSDQILGDETHLQNWQISNTATSPAEVSDHECVKSSKVPWRLSSNNTVICMYTSLVLNQGKNYNVKESNEKDFPVSY